MPLTTTYQGAPVLDVWMDWAGFSPAVRSEQAGVILDTVTGLSLWKPRGAYPRAEMSMLFRVYGRDSIDEFRVFVEGRRGRQQAFWVPTWQRDLELAADASGATIQVEPANYASAVFPITQRRHLALTYHDRTQVLREITAASAGATESLTLDGSVGPYRADLVLVSYLLLVRLSQDSVSYRYRSREVMECELAMIEVPEEYP